MTTKTQKKTFGVFTTFLLHLHPPMVDQRAIKFTRTFGLGGINALLFILLAITGVLLRFSYIPTPELAYESILNLQNQTLLGSLIRNIHHWSAKLMIISAFLHLLRVFYTQSVYHERKRNWFYGLLLFVVVLAFNFTGYLLPWDQLSFWAVTIVTNMPSYIPFIGNEIAYFIRGGDYVDGNTLLNFYNLHTAILPLFFMVLMSLHFYLVRKAKGVTVQPEKEKEMVKVYPNLVIKEALVASILVVFILLISMLFNAPLLDYANPLLSPNPIKAPWYFAGMQELLILIHPVLAVFLLPTLLLSFLIWIPYMGIPNESIGRWFYSSKGKFILIYSSLLAALVSLILVFIVEYYLQASLAEWPSLLSGSVPFILYILLISAILWFLKNQFTADKNEMILAVFSIIISSYIALSMIGIYLRGMNMELIF